VADSTVILLQSSGSVTGF